MQLAPCVGFVHSYTPQSESDSESESSITCCRVPRFPRRVPRMALLTAFSSAALDEAAAAMKKPSQKDQEKTESSGQPWQVDSVHVTDDDCQTLAVAAEEVE